MEEITFIQKPKPIWKSKWNIKNETKEDIIDLDEEVISVEKSKEPREIRQVFKCPICKKAYISITDVEDHMSSFHRISKRFQRNQMQTGQSMYIITKNL